MWINLDHEFNCETCTRISHVVSCCNHVVEYEIISVWWCTPYSGIAVYFAYCCIRALKHLETLFLALVKGRQCRQSFKHTLKMLKHHWKVFIYCRVVMRNKVQTLVSSLKSFKQISTCSSPQPAMTCSPLSSVEHTTSWSDFESLLRPSTNLGRSFPSWERMELSGSVEQETCDNRLSIYIFNIHIYTNGYNRWIWFNMCNMWFIYD